MRGADNPTAISERQVLTLARDKYMTIFGGMVVINV
jgi:hypothetical protein